MSRISLWLLGPAAPSATHFERKSPPPPCSLLASRAISACAAASSARLAYEPSLAGGGQGGGGAGEALVFVALALPLRPGRLSACVRSRGVSRGKAAAWARLSGGASSLRPEP